MTKCCSTSRIQAPVRRELSARSKRCTIGKRCSRWLRRASVMSRCGRSVCTTRAQTTSLNCGHAGHTFGHSNWCLVACLANFRHSNPSACPTHANKSCSNKTECSRSREDHTCLQTSLRRGRACGRSGRRWKMAAHTSLRSRTARSGTVPAASTSNIEYGTLSRRHGGHLCTASKLSTQ